MEKDEAKIKQYYRRRRVNNKGINILLIGLIVTIIVLIMILIYLICDK